MKWIRSLDFVFKAVSIQHDGFGLDWGGERRYKRIEVLTCLQTKTLENAIDVPEEICDLVPQKTCRGVYKLVPYLVPEPECKDVPREVCSFGVKGTKLGEKPIVTKVTKEDTSNDTKPHLPLL